MSTPPGAVLVGYDGSADSELALAWADDAAAQARRPLQVLISEVDATQVLEATKDWHAAKMAQLEGEARERTESSKAPEVSVALVDTPPTAALIEASADSALVVVGAKGHSLMSGVLLGSVSQHVARHAACPAVVVRRPHDPQNRIVVGVDGSPGSATALEFAVDLAGRTGARLSVVYGWRALSGGAVTELGAPFDSRFNDEMVIAQRLLSESVAGLSERHPDVRIETEAIPVPPSRCLSDASHNASLVVVGSRGRGAFAGMLLGSVSQSVLHHAQCPVAVVR